MPTYEFRCPKGHEFSRFYKTISGAATELPCPECNAKSERLISGGAGLQFKGSGFYLTDYGKNAHRGTEGAGRKAEGGESKSDSKPSEAKSESKPAKSDSPAKAESPKPKAESPKPKAKSE